MRRRLDRMVLGQLADFALVECEACGFEQANASGPQVELAWSLGLVCGCLVCGHPYARTSPRHAAAVASLRLCSDLKPP